MKYYASFYHLSTGYIQGSSPPEFSPDHVKPIPACGDRSVIWLDGRITESLRHAIAADECKKRGYIGYKLGITHNGYESRLFMVDKKTDLQTISARITA